MNSPRRWSITTKLTLLYTLSLSAMLLIATLLWSYSLTHGLGKIGSNVGVTGIRLLHGLIENNPNNPILLKQEIARAMKGWGSVANMYYARILDSNGREIITTPGMDRELNHSIFPEPVELSQLPGSYKRLILSDKYFLLISAKVPVGEHDFRYIQLAINISYSYKFYRTYLWYLGIILLVGVGCSAILGFMLTRKGMRSLQNITDAAEHITINQLHKRIDPKDWPKELSNLACAFNQMLDRIEYSFNRLSQFSADLAHEFRTPINNLMGEAEIALSRERSTDDYKEVLASSLEEYRRLTHMIDSLLFLARAENPNTRIEKKAVNILSLFETIRDFFDVIAEEKNVKIICEGPDIEIIADPILLRRAINNLVSNALRYTPPLGTLTLSTDQTDELVHICVSDTGIGIAEEHLNRLTDRFYRVDQKNSLINTGLGLAIVKSIMDLHNGRMIIISQCNKGTEITLNFPIE